MTPRRLLSSSLLRRRDPRFFPLLPSPYSECRGPPARPVGPALPWPGLFHKLFVSQQHSGRQADGKDGCRGPSGWRV